MNHGIEWDTEDTPDKSFRSGEKKTRLLKPWRLDSNRRLIQDVIDLQMRPSKGAVLNLDPAIVNDIRGSPCFSCWFTLKQLIL
ncbi:hypothetical protein ILYODFUR_022926 [Ilyodon furcidens]|uniref:Uncharacterized protein n=1 Tax=Ilyodon furcidens TaxID=33524 RepID=A0ABV0UVN5_9TELE